MSDLVKTSALAVKPPPGSNKLPDNAQWQNRFEIRSESSNRIYIIAQNKNTLKWGCSCPSYLTRRRCKHLIDGCCIPTSQIHGYGQIEEKKTGKLG